MKKRVVFLITIILISASILMISNKIQATEKSLSCSLETEKTEIKQGEETSVTLKTFEYERNDIPNPSLLQTRVSETLFPRDRKH